MPSAVRGEAGASRPSPVVVELGAQGATPLERMDLRRTKDVVRVLGRLPETQDTRSDTEIGHAYRRSEAGPASWRLGSAIRCGVVDLSACWNLERSVRDADSGSRSIVGPGSENLE